MDKFAIDIRDNNNYTPLLNFIQSNISEFEMIDWCYFINAINLSSEFINQYKSFFMNMAPTIIHFFNHQQIGNYDFRSYIRLSILVDLLKSMDTEFAQAVQLIHNIANSKPLDHEFAILLNDNILDLF